jgi:hypothetical protein
MTDSVRVANSTQAGLLLDLELRPVTTALMQRPHSAAELGRALKINVQRAHYLLSKLIAADIARLDSVQPRAGRSVKRYRMVPRWFVPFEVTESETLEAFLAAQILPRIERVVNLSVQQIGATFETWGYWIEQEGEGSNLRMGDASAFKHRLNALLAEFAALEDRQQHPAYTVCVQLVRGVVG